MLTMSYLQSPTLFRFGKKCSQALLKRKEYSAGIIRYSKKHTKENEDGDRSFGFSSQTSQTPLYSGHVPTSLLQKGIIIFMKYTFFNIPFLLTSDIYYNKIV